MVHSLKVKGVDPRAFSKEALKAPKPLPFISRKALRRVRDRLEPPAKCNLCNSPRVALVRHETVYGRAYGDWPFLYACRDCGAYVGLHKFTDIPLGTLADKTLREARQTSKMAFHKLVELKFLTSRTAGYKWLAGKMKIPPKVCHFGFFSQEQCASAWQIILEELECLS